MNTKKLLIIICIIANQLINSAKAQAPQSFNYQAVARNSNGIVLINQAVSFRISLLQGSATGTNTYTETHTATTNQFGLVNFAIGTGSVVSGIFSNINWANGPYFIQVELDVAGGSNYILMSTTQLLSVPYAMYASNARDTSIWKMNTSNKVYYNSGKIGIGNNNPQHLLHIVRNNLSDLGMIKLESRNSALGSGIHMQSSLFNNLWAIGTTANHDALSIVYADTSISLTNTLINFNKIGTIGIGASAPSSNYYKVDLGGNLNVQGRYIQIGKDTIGECGIVKNVPINTVGYDGSMIFGMDANYGTIEVHHKLGGYAGGANLSNFYTVFNTTEGGISAGERMRISPNGNVGIGTKTPDFLLTVRNVNNVTPNTKTALLSNAIQDTLFQFVIAKGVSTNNPGDIMTQLGQAYNGGAITEGIHFIRGGGSTAGSISFSTYSQERMRINTNGDIGIGNNNPQRKLHVNDVMRLEPRNSAPTSAGKGDIYFDNTINKLRVYDGTSWQNCW